MNRRTFLAAALVALPALAAGESLAATPSTSKLTRDQIRNMPLTSRPNRPGHFYGNTVRRLNSR